jgi:hypothetical protein
MYLATAMDVSWMRGYEINPVEANRVFIVTGDKTLIARLSTNIKFRHDYLAVYGVFHAVR